ncbi:HBL/NHE enterotoxin family protein [Bacillus mycoides]|uniref:HBL/NHE enterotoxin family protein n=1 Tax=Bacillus mycoides TaxID=1405 RepID=UPI003D647D1B
MFRIKKKSLFLCLTTFIVVQSVIPNYAWADSESPASKLDKAASAILAQHDTFSKNLDGLTTIDNQLKSALTTHEKTAQDNANYWLNTLEPSTQAVVKDIIGYDSTFQSIYKNSIDKFVSKNKQETVNILNTLQNDMNQKQTLVKEELDKLRKYREERLSPNVRDFTTDVNQILAKKDGEYAVINSLKKSIAFWQDKYDEAQRSYDSIAADGSGAKNTVIVYTSNIHK